MELYDPNYFLCKFSWTKEYKVLRLSDFLHSNFDCSRNCGGHKVDDKTVALGWKRHVKL